HEEADALGVGAGLGPAGCRLSPGRGGEAEWRCRGLGAAVAPVDLTAALLSGLVRGVEARVGQAVDHAVLTVPADWGPSRHAAVLRAARAAGLPDALRLLQEPVAAALAHGLGAGLDGELALVVDIGGGTTDVSLVQAFAGALELLGTIGDAALGGNDVDAALAARLFPEAGRGDPAAQSAAERAKITLSAGPGGPVAAESGQVAAACMLSDLQAVLPPFFAALAALLEEFGTQHGIGWAMEPRVAAERAVASLGEGGGEDPAQALGRSGAAPPSPGPPPQATHAAWGLPPPRRVTRVLCVGQATEMLGVHAFLALLTGVRPSVGMPPAHAVAAGAAVYAGMLLGSVPELEIVEGPFAAAPHGRTSGF
ncbi:hypothetical protein APUTEX25_004389, partial [Auxenochlorella protothecoides]